MQQINDKVTPTEEIELLSKPVRVLMNEQKFTFSTRDPESTTGHNLLRDKYSLPQPNLFKYGRS